MHVEFSDQQQALRREIRSYFTKLMTPELKKEVHYREAGQAYKDTIRQMGRDGWLAVGWPEEYGGRGFGAVEQLIFFEETRVSGAPFPFVTVNTVGPALIAHGSDQHKEFFLPKIAAGELHFAIGYTEPEAGTDLAALRTRAEREGDEFIINGNKVFTSGAEAADYVWLAACTDPDAERPHNGISILMVNTDQPGFSLSPIYTVGGVRTNATYYENMRCPVNMVAGEINGGWKLITSQLNHERVGLAAAGINALALYRQVLDWARTPQPSGQRPIDEPWVQITMARVHHQLSAMRVLNSKAAWQIDRGEPEPAFASAMKAYSTEVVIDTVRQLLDIVGSQGLIREDSPGAFLNGALEDEYQRCQINTFGGGVAEVMRDLVASFGLGMRAYKR